MSCISHWEHLKNLSIFNGGRAYYIIESKVQWKPFWLATQQYPQNDWLGGNFPYTMTYAHGPPLYLKDLLSTHFIFTVN